MERTDANGFMRISLEETIALNLGFDTMKPIDEDMTPPAKDIPEDDEAGEIEKDMKTKPKILRSRRKRTKIQEYGSLGDMIVWMAFFLIAWIVFLIAWITLFAVDYGIYENIGICIASLLIIGALNVLLWVPTAKEGWKARISALAGIGWLIFLALWLPFANDFALIYSINAYQNVVIVIASFLIMLVVVIAPWSTEISIGVDDQPGLLPRLKGTIAGFILWVMFIGIWLWFFAGDPSYSVNQNATIVLLSFALFCAILLGLWLPWTRRRGEGPENWWAIGLAFIWVLALTAWFWFFADDYDAYQNFAVFLLSLMVMVTISGGAQWKKYRGFESLDRDD